MANLEKSFSTYFKHKYDIKDQKVFIWDEASDNRKGASLGESADNSNVIKRVSEFIGKLGGQKRIHLNTEYKLD